MVAFADLRESQLDRDTPNIATAVALGDELAADVNALEIPTITNPTLPTGEWLPHTHNLTMMEYSWLDSRGVPDAYLQVRMPEAIVQGDPITPEMEPDVIERSNWVTRTIVNFHRSNIKIQQMMAERAARAARDTVSQREEP